jgi:hypothetical protein
LAPYTAIALSNLQKGAEKMRENTTAAARVRRAFRGGRPRQIDLTLTPTRACLEASRALNSLQESMAAAGLAEEDVRVGLAMISEGHVCTVPIPALKDIPFALHKVLELGEGWRPLGIIFGQVDREAPPKAALAVWVHSWLVDPASVAYLRAAAKFVSNGDYGKRSLN